MLSFLGRWSRTAVRALPALSIAGWGAACSLFGLPTTTQAATLRAAANNQYVSATATGTSYLMANAAAPGAWEEFEIIDNANGTVSLKATVSGNIVSADIGLASPNTGRLIANRTSIGTWEQFTLVPQSNGTVALRAEANQMYVSADLNNGGALVANRTTVQGWEQFTLTDGTGEPPDGAPDLGPNAHIVSPTTPNLQGLIDSIYSAQQPNHFGSRRDAILLMPGNYEGLRIPVGFYTQVLGLGASPDDVHVNGDLRSSAFLGGDNATQNFWRGAENFSVTPSLGIGNNTMQWAVSQAIPFRRMHVKGNMKLNQNNGWASGGWFSDVLVDGQVNSASQQQWISRNTQWGSWIGSNWNMVFVGVPNPPAGSFPTPGQRYTKIAQTPVVREKPYLFINAKGKWAVRVPSLRTNSAGISWANGAGAGKTIPLKNFYIAKPADSAATLNAKLAAGKHLLFTPGVYVLNDTLQVNNAKTVILGIGFPTLRSDNGKPLMKTADVHGVTISGLFFDAGATESGVLLEVGPPGSVADHSANPTVLHDVFFRIGGAAAGRVGIALSINANHTIVDHTWLWRADHGDGVGWNDNPSANGLWVNGQNVTIYGLFAEHFQKHQVVWNGNGGRVYFYQSEIPYDPPSQSAWNSATGRGYASYKVSDNVTSHEAWGLGVYSVFTNAGIFLDRAIEVPVNSNVRFHNMISVCLGSNGGIVHVINNTGAQTVCNAQGTPTVTDFP
ncbi:coagulation factor 5/8 type domain-containing protein [Ideonella sp. DXS29W]|uniref:Coagulation factor 5/8 type domain-containing protein n=1 Tax=Ideonella lacteola TaxID=2984193 RepID=A0ABU9BRJ5_9BURK